MNMRIILGYKYYWEFQQTKKKKTAGCVGYQGLMLGYMFQIYTNEEITGISVKAVWMFRNDQVIKISKKYNISPSIT